MNVEPESRRGRVTLVLGLVVAVWASGCSIHHHHPGHAKSKHEKWTEGHAHRKGPPPHAVAHGHRRKHPVDRVEIEFDRDIDLYVVVGHSAIYWDGKRYIRWRDGRWTVAGRIGGGWASVTFDDVPQNLRRRHANAHSDDSGKPGRKKAKKGHGHGRGAAKHAY